MKKILGCIVSSLIFSPAFAEVSRGEFDSTATINNVCLIEADNINFGQVFSPLTTQGYKGNMRVHCSKEAAYTIQLAYGGIYGSGTGNGGGEPIAGRTIEVIESLETYNYFGIKDYSKSIGNIACPVNSYQPEAVFFSTNEAAKAYGYQTMGWQPDSKKVCKIGSQAEAVPVNWMGAPDGSARAFLTIGNSPYDYGIMIGAIKGGHLAYKVTIPGDINKVWNSGLNAYSSKGSGVSQNIEMNAYIVPNKSSSQYLAQDNYFDTVTAVISY